MQVTGQSTAPGNWTATCKESCEARLMPPTKMNSKGIKDQGKQRELRGAGLPCPAPVAAGCTAPGRC